MYKAKNGRILRYAQLFLFYLHFITIFTWSKRPFPSLLTPVTHHHIHAPNPNKSQQDRIVRLSRYDIIAANLLDSRITIK